MRNSLRLFSLITCLLAHSGVSVARERSEADELRRSLVLEEADRALAGGDHQKACDAWVSLLSKGAPYAEVALHRLVETMGFCDLGPHAQRLLSLAFRVEGTPRFKWRFFDVARQVLSKYGDPAGAERFTPLHLPAAAAIWTPVPAPILTAFTAAPPKAVRPPGIQEGAVAENPTFGTGGVLVSDYCVAVDSRSRYQFRFSLPNPAVVYLGDEPFLTVGPDHSRGSPQPRFEALNLEPGCHCLTLVEAVENSGLEPEIQLIPVTGARAVRDRCAGPPPAWEPARTAPRCPSGDQLLCAWYSLAEGMAPADSADLLEQAFSSSRHLMFALSYLGSPQDSSGRSEELALELLTSYLSAGDDCYGRLSLAQRHLDLGEDRQAELALAGADEQCRMGLQGLLIQADLAVQRQWTALHEQLLWQAKDRFPKACVALDRWHSVKLDQGIHVPAETFPVRCPDVIRRQEAFLARAGRSSSTEGQPPLSPRQFRELNLAERYGYLRRLPRDPEVDSTALLKKLVARDPQLAWQLSDLWLARGDPDRARSYARLAGTHRAAWGPVRSQAGKLFFWEPVAAHMTDYEETIDSYLKSGFAEDMPQVVVLDEAVVAPDRNGWYTLVETVVLHVVSPDAAEDVGEISLGAGEEVLELAVRKADGTWIGPEDQSEGAIKETVSLSGLAPGDFVVKTVAREVPSDRPAGCYSLSPFYFGTREAPVFLSRYVVLLQEDQAFSFSVEGTLDVDEEIDGARVFEKRLVEPVVAEPGCPDSSWGLTVVHGAAGCLDWAGLRDRTSDRFLRFCDAPLPPDMAAASGHPDDLFRYVVENFEEDGSGLLAEPFSVIVEDRRGSLVLALHCGFIAAGFDSHIVFLNSTGAQPLDYDRAALNYFDMAVVYAGAEYGRWYDPFDYMIPAGYLRPSLRDRPGIFMTPYYPRLFVRSPKSAGEDGWTVGIDGVVDRAGQASGTIRIDARGVAAAELDRVFRNANESSTRQAIQSLAGQFIPRAVAGRFDVDSRFPRVRLDIDFQLPLELTSGSDTILLFVPPAPEETLTRLAERRAPLYFPGFLPMNAKVYFKAEKGYNLGASEKSEDTLTRFGRLQVRAENVDDGFEVEKQCFASPAVVQPRLYPEFLRLITRLKRFNSVRLEVNRGPDN